MLIDFWNEFSPILFILPFLLWFRKCLKWENFGEIDEQIIDIFHPSIPNNPIYGQSEWSVFICI